MIIQFFPQNFLVSYISKIYDEFITPKIIKGFSPITENDGVFMFNFRADRMRQICEVFSNPNFAEFESLEPDHGSPKSRHHNSHRAHAVRSEHH